MGKPRQELDFEAWVRGVDDDVESGRWSVVQIRDEIEKHLGGTWPPTEVGPRTRTIVINLVEVDQRVEG